MNFESAKTHVLERSDHNDQDNIKRNESQFLELKDSSSNYILNKIWAKLPFSGLRQSGLTRVCGELDTRF